MKFNRLLFTLLALVALTVTAPAADELFRAREAQVDLFAAYATDQVSPLTTSISTLAQGGDWRGGVGLNYFLTRHVGAGIDTHFGDFKGGFFDNVSASLIVRAPIESLRTAPYAFGGAGGNFEGINHWTYHAGLGVEVRATRNVGVFGDVRYTWNEGSVKDGALTRIGVRLNF